MPVDLSGATVSVLVPPLFDVYQGTTHADGTFSIPDVPVGKVLLKLGSRYIETSHDNIDLVADALGRPNLADATLPTPLTFAVTDLSPWQATDELQMFCSSSGTAAWAMETAATAGEPTVNDTSLSSFTYDLSRAGTPTVITGSQGDLLSLVQLSTANDGARSYRTVSRIFTPSSFDVANGGMANLTGAFTPVTTSTTLDGVWDRPAFDAELVAHGSSGALTNWSTLAVSALSEAATRGFYSDEPDVLIFAPGYTNDHTPVTMSWPIGDPYPVEWTRIAWVRYYRYHLIQLGSAAPLAVFDRLRVYRELSSISPQAPIVPIVGLVVAPQVNGMSARGTLTGVGTTPTLSWTAPTIGTASRYYVDIYQVTTQAGATSRKRLANIETSSTEIIVPPGILASGQTYIFDITARSAGALDLETTPNRDSLPEGWALTATGLVTP